MVTEWLLRVNIASHCHLRISRQHPESGAAPSLLPPKPLLVLSVWIFCSYAVLDTYRKA